MAKKNNKKGVFSSIRDSYRKVVIFFKNHNVQFVFGLLFVAFAVFLLSSFVSFFSKGASDHSVIEMASAVDASVVNTSGKSGAVVAKYLINDCFGWASLVFLPLVVLVAIRMMRLANFKLGRWIVYGFFTIVWSSLLFSFVFGDLLEENYVSPGGAHGDFLKALFIENIGVVGLILLLVVSLLLFMIYISRETITWMRNMFTFKSLRNETESGETECENQESVSVEIVETDEENISSDEPATPLPVVVTIGDETDVEIEACEEEDTAEFEDEVIADDDVLAKQFDAMSASIGVSENAVNSDDAVLAMEVEKADGDDDMGGRMLRPINPKDELSYYKPPTIDLLDEYEQAVQSIDKDEQAANANKIVEVLKNFGIEISSIKATVGPTITLYEITPAPGIRISKIRNLEDDIAMSLAALCIRIVAPIPGKGTIGIEVPNAHKQIVPMASLLNSRKYKETDMALPLALGKTISNEVYMVDMAKMPHLLVAGATGMGKSVGLNAIITSLLYTKHPAQLKFVMIDPKMVEFSVYNKLERHFLAKMESDEEPIITEPKKAVCVLNSLVEEMGRRLELLKMATSRNIVEYNEKFTARRLNPQKGHRFLPYIVVIIDEFADLIMTAKEVEVPVMRLAQKARAVGIHLIIATQRPDVKVITGGIKANFPARIAFRVMQMIDSRTIIDQPGANQLIGRGDMLFSNGGELTRIQCALVETKEVERLVDFIAKQQGYTEAYPLPDFDMDAGVDGNSSSDGESGAPVKYDALFGEVARAAVTNGMISTSSIQRNYEVGFNRAGRIMLQLERAGIVGPQVGAKPREIKFYDLPSLEAKLQSLGVF